MIVPEAIRQQVKKLFAHCERRSPVGNFPRFADFKPVIDTLAELDPATGEKRKAEEARRREAEEAERMRVENQALEAARRAEEERRKWATKFEADEKEKERHEPVSRAPRASDGPRHGSG